MNLDHGVSQAEIDRYQESLAPADDVIVLDRVERIFPTVPPVAALIDVRLRVRRGDYLSVVGPSGSGSRRC